MFFFWSVWKGLQLCGFLILFFSVPHACHRRLYRCCNHLTEETKTTPVTTNIHMSRWWISDMLVNERGSAMSPILWREHRWREHRWREHLWREYKGPVPRPPATGPAVGDQTSRPLVRGPTPVRALVEGWCCRGPAGPGYESHYQYGRRVEAAQRSKWCKRERGRGAEGDR
jgi:hypothetical protein